MVRDGLPHFGSTRDDWIGKARPHKGLDIYVDRTGVQAVAAGTVVGTGLGDRAGGWAKIDHGNGVETVYVHVSGLDIDKGDQVSQGQEIAAIDGPVGNAIEPQLHFELRLDGEAVDPVPYLFELAPDDLKSKILLENERLEALERERALRIPSELEKSPE
jgi:murein DD-endopeptidase MepM/ murein hydrolase activator NlpD